VDGHKNVSAKCPGQQEPPPLVVAALNLKTSLHPQAILQPSFAQLLRYCHQTYQFSTSQHSSRSAKASPSRRPQAGRMCAVSTHLLVCSTSQNTSWVAVALPSS
jgi:hypothetical protein